jgi:uncharacterized membrane protein
VRTRLIAAALIVALAALALYFINPAGRPRCTELDGAEALSLPLDGLTTGTPKFFCFHDDRGDKLRFVLARGSDGKVRSVFDACRQCYKYREGFTAADGNLVCRQCGNRYPVDHMMAGKASCAPVPLEAAVKGGSVKVRVSDLKAGASLF